MTNLHFPTEGEHGYQPEQVVDATCTSQGYTLTTCSRCDYKAKDNYTDPVEGKHVWNEGTVLKPATCTTAGVLKKTCMEPECGVTIYAGIPAHHAVTDWKIETKATCTTDGQNRMRRSGGRSVCAGGCGKGCR